MAGGREGSSPGSAPGIRSGLLLASAAMSAPEIDLLLSLLDQGFERKAWHGPNLLGTLRGITPAAAAFRPARGRHNIQELIVHCAYWKYAVRRRITGETRGSFPYPGSNWFPRPDRGDARALAADLKLLKGCHRELREVVASFDPARLGERLKVRGWTMRETIAGVAAHDLYHAGQISLLKRLHADRRTR